MIAVPRTIHEVLDQIADGRPVDWRVVEDEIAGEEHRRVLAALRIIERVGDVHRTAGRQDY